MSMDIEKRMERGIETPGYGGALHIYQTAWILTVLFLPVIAFTDQNQTNTVPFLIRAFFPMFFQISVYYLFLTPLIILLRRYVSARTCALLWILPSLLGLVLGFNLYPEEPSYILYVNGRLMRTLFLIWFTVYLILFVKNILLHLIFRKQILRNARPVTDSAILSLWHQTQDNIGIKRSKYYPLLIAPSINTPLSVGMFRRSIRVLLPHTYDSTEDLQLIFLHELIHIQHKDAQNKFFLELCRTLCWFNPFLWLATRQSAYDMELSCDETVLLGTSEDTRRRYAELLLKTSGEEHGFTTCLSASARSLRTRLSAVMNTQPKRSGGFIIAVLFIIFFLSGGRFALAYDDGTGYERVFSSMNTDNLTLSSITSALETGIQHYSCTDSTRFFQILADLPLYQVTDYHGYSNEWEELQIIYQNQADVIVLNLTESYLRSTLFSGEAPVSRTYYLGENNVAEQLHHFLIPYSEGDDDGRPDFSTMAITFLTPEGKEEHITCYGSIVLARHHEDILLYEAEPITLSLPLPSEIWLDFPKTPYHEDIHVRVENWSGSISHEYSNASLDYLSHITLEDKAAHYAIYASYPDANDQLLDVVYYFDVIPSENNQGGDNE